MVTKATRDVLDLSVRPVLSVDINGGTIDGTAIGATTPDTGAFTNLQAANATFTNNLNVTGATLTGTIYASYADLAEVYRADKIYPKGTVLCIGGDQEVTESENALDVDVFGVVSSDPAMVLNQHQTDDMFDVAVAIVGRIPCRVVGPVLKGQRLVTSHLPGVAMGFNPLYTQYKSGRKLIDWDMAQYGVNPFFARSLVTDSRKEERLIEVVLVTQK